MKRVVLKIPIHTIFEHKIPFTPVFKDYRTELENKKKNPWLFPLDREHYLQKGPHIIHTRKRYMQDFGLVLALDYYKYTCKLKEIL